MSVFDQPNPRQPTVLVQELYVVTKQLSLEETKE